MKEIQVEKGRMREVPKQNRRGIFSEWLLGGRRAIATIQLYNSKGSDVTSQE